MVRAQDSHGCGPWFTSQAALIAVRLTKLVVPPNGSSITRLYCFLSLRLSVPHVKLNMIEASDLVRLTGTSNHAINGGSVFWESHPQAH